MQIKEETFKKLATPLCQNENKKPKKYHKNYYNNFIEYLEKINNKKEINSRNFKKYFLDFCDYYFDNDNRIEFSDNQKRIIAEKSGYCCAMPHCKVYTKIHDTKDTQKTSGFGQAAHIYSASIKNKVRPPVGIDIKFIESEKNGMWLCANCHNYADYSPLEYMYDTEIMFAYKKNIEDEVEILLKNKKYNDMNEDEKNELHNNLLKTKKHSGNFNKLDMKTSNLIAVINGIRDVSVKFNIDEFIKFSNLQSFEIKTQGIHFHNIDNSAKKIFPETLRLQSFEYRDFLIKFKKNKHLNLRIDNCVLINDNQKAIAKGSLYDKNSSFNDLFIFRYEYDRIKNVVSAHIDIKTENLFNLKQNIRDFDCFGKVLNLIEAFENDEVEVKVKVHKNEGYLLINEYQKMIVNFNSLKQFIMFLNVVQYISVNESVDIIISKDLFHNNIFFLNSLNLLYETFINENIPSEIYLLKDINNLDSHTIEDKKLIENEKIEFNITLLCDNFEIFIVYRMFNYINNKCDYTLIKTEESDCIIKLI